MRGPRLSVPRRATRRPVGRIAAALAMLPASIAFGDVVVLTATRDNSMFDNGNSNGAGDAIFCGRTGNFGGSEIVQRGLIAFNVADGVPAGATVISASIEMSLVQTSFMNVQSSFALHRLTSDWGEGESMSAGGSGAPPMPGDATWANTFFPADFWTSPGGDRVPIASSSQTVGIVLGRYTWGSAPQLIADVQDMLDNPGGDFGWILIGDEVTPHSANKFGSKDSVDADFHPTLTVEFVGCPWDCGDYDGNVGINDFLALLGQWDSSGTSCDFGLGTTGVGIDEFLALLANWGPCP